MATTAYTLAQRCRRFMGDWPQQDALTASVTASNTTINVADTTIYSKNWIIETDIVPALAEFVPETVLVTSLASSIALTVRRGQRGSTSGAHSIAVPLLIQPSFLYQDYLDALNAAIAATYPLLYRPVIDESVTLTVGTYEYTVPNMPVSYGGSTSVIPNIYHLQVKDTGDTVWRDKVDWTVNRGATPKLKFKRDEAGTLRILGFGPLAPLASFSDSLDSLFPPQAEDALVEYACGRLLASGEARRVRVDSGVVDQREQANKTGSSSTAGRDLITRFYKRLADSAMPPLPRHIVPVI